MSSPPLHTFIFFRLTGWSSSANTSPSASPPRSSMPAQQQQQQQQQLPHSGTSPSRSSTPTRQTGRSSSEQQQQQQQQQQVLGSAVGLGARSSPPGAGLPVIPAGLDPSPRGVARALHPASATQPPLSARLSPPSSPPRSAGTSPPRSPTRVHGTGGVATPSVRATGSRGAGSAAAGPELVRSRRGSADMQQQQQQQGRPRPPHGAGSARSSDAGSGSLPQTPSKVTRAASFAAMSGAAGMGAFALLGRLLSPGAPGKERDKAVKCVRMGAQAVHMDGSTAMQGGQVLTETVCM